MKKLLLILGISTFFSSSTLSVIACKKNNDDAYTIKVQAEKEWVPFYQKAVNSFNQKLEAEKSKFKIKIKESGTFDELGLFDKLPFTDRSLSDVFVLPFDRFSTFVTENKLSDVSDLTISEFDSRLGGNVDNDIAIHNGKKYGVTLNIETLVAVYNKTALANNPARSLEEMVLANKNQQNPVYNATFGDLWYASVLYNTLLTSDIPTLVEVASDGGVKTVFDNNNSDFIDVAKVSYDFGQTLPPSMFDTKTRWVGGKGLYDYVLENKTNWFLAGPWDYSKKYTSQYGVLKTDGVTDEDTVFGIKRKDIAFDSIDKYQVNNKSWKHFKAGFLMSLNARLDRQQSKLNSAGKTKKMVASEFIKELLSVDYAYDWYKYAGKITPYKVGLDKIVTEAKKDSDSLVPELIDAIINGYANNSVRPKHHIFNGFWATYETNYNSRVFPHSISKIIDGEQYAKSLSADIANYIKGAIN